MMNLVETLISDEVNEKFFSQATMLQAGLSASTTGGMTKVIYSGQQTIYRPPIPTSVDLNWKPPSRPLLPERYEPKFRIINKDNAKDMRR